MHFKAFRRCSVPWQAAFLSTILTAAAGTAVFAETPEDAGIAAIKALALDAGTVVEATHEDAPTVTLPDGKTLDRLPSRTVVKIVLNPAKGSNIRVEIWLPDAGKWNGRLLGQGNGGAAGGIPLGSLAGPLAGGYAVATTDMGTSPNADSGIGNPEVWKDFGFRATHLMTVVARQVVKAYYGRGPDYAYFNGRSTGGQQSLQEAQRYPEDYDGIVGSVPAHCRTPLHAYFLWNDQILAKCPFTPSQEKNVIDAGVEYMASREVPALAGKMVSDPRCDGKDIEAVIQLAMQKDPSLTPAHAAALRKLFDGPRSTTTGERIFDGVPFGSPLDALSHGNLYLFKWVFGKDKDLGTIDFGKDIDTYTAALGPYLNAESLDLAPFAARGGKLLMASGAADSCVPYTATLDYYERVVERFGGDLPKVQAFFRYFIIPGLTHRTGPLNNLPNLLELVIQWREKGVAPGEIRARRIVDGKTEIDVPIYPYPAKAAWDEAASAYKAIDGPRGGVERIAERFRPPAAE
ncbi:Tannase and feruloyl esterase [Verrucomicrobium sp. GAS474]|uniref:tannase/feruloyl esterase family alpha/beta hydrolase n=1 Tax=Verrucomicrobium sp. GAS474 TaxID=1882831 RepID=UPI00087A3DFF|nr:tannase/feruloyl esterase family alpha/beta hydrolase [Verrucomicrobium sp. GAS474]SDT89175.1 Tannase and feruloyl esterase [Verrucomicrobium sp. GAS474]